MRNDVNRKYFILLLLRAQGTFQTLIFV